MANRREKNNRQLGSLEEKSKDTTHKIDKDEKYSDENLNVTDTDSAELDPRIRHASQATGNNIEEGDEDYDDEEQKDRE